MKLPDIITESDIGSSGSRLRVFARSDMIRDLTAYNKSLWSAAVRQKMTDILAMPVGWDGYDAPRVSQETVIYSAQVLQDLWQHGVPAPQISPLSSGGVMIEWQTAEKDFTLEIERPYVVTMIYDDGSGELVEKELGLDLSSAAQQITGLHMPVVQVVAA